jgi:hypothetical protein
MPLPTWYPSCIPVPTPRMYPAAERSVLSAIIRLIDSGKVTCEGEPSTASHYALEG